MQLMYLPQEDLEDVTFNPRSNLKKVHMMPKGLNIDIAYKTAGGSREMSVMCSSKAQSLIS